MFIRYETKGGLWNIDNRKYAYNYTIVDDDFNFSISLGYGFNNADGKFDYAILKEYDDRGLDVAKNAAKLVIFTCEIEGTDIESAKSWQEPMCKLLIPNWGQMVIERDNYLQKIKLLK